MNTSILRKIEVILENGESLHGYKYNDSFWKDGNTMYSCRCSEDSRFIVKRDHVVCEKCGRELKMKLDRIQQHISDTYKIFDVLNK